MRALVTGATGFIGGNLTVELLNNGFQVRALVREGSNRKSLEGLDVEVTLGDLRDVSSLERALDGCEVLFHVAANYALWTPDPKLTYDTNVTGTENVLTAALTKGVERVVYTSTESTIGISQQTGLGTEDREMELGQLGGHYKRSKLLAERVALGFCRKGLPVVVVHPTFPVGPRDVKPTPTGQIIVDFLNGRMPAYVNTGLNVVAVEDVARGHVLALEKGKPGERYILGNQNLTLREIFEILGEISGIRPPGFRIPLWLAMGVARVDELVVARVTGKPPRVPIAGVQAARKFRHFDCSKAIKQLGLPQTPVEIALDRAVRWFRENGYAR